MQSVDFCRNKIIEVLRDDFNESPEAAELSHIYSASATVVRRLLAKRRSEQTYCGDKEVYYLSMEFLMGRSLRNDLYNLGIKDDFEAALSSLGVSPEKIYEQEPDAGLGNGGLGRHAFLTGLPPSASLPLGIPYAMNTAFSAKSFARAGKPKSPMTGFPAGASGLPRIRKTPLW